MNARVRVRLTPAVGADRIDGRAKDANGAYLKARVRVAPEDGKANTALEALIANALGVAKGRVRVARGHASRMKTVEIEGASEADVAGFLDVG